MRRPHANLRLAWDGASRTHRWLSRRTLALACLLGLTAARAEAYSCGCAEGDCGPGVNLRWEACHGDGGTANRTFACDTNSGSERLVGTFVLSTDLLDVSGFDAFVEVASAATTLPVWWQFYEPGTCRTTSLRLGLLPPAGSVTCQDWSGGLQGGGIGLYSIGTPTANRARIRVVGAVPAADVRDLSTGVEYFAFSLEITHAKTVGSTACAGCPEPVCIAFAGVQLLTPQSTVHSELFGAAGGAGSDVVTWQQGTVPEYESHFTPGEQPCKFYGFSSTLTCAAGVTSSRQPTWGAIKSLYR
jgi:hypothetical protein